MYYRSPKQCRERFHQNLKPYLNREPISADEGLVIERMVNEIGKRWAEIAHRLGNRSDNAVKACWNGNMNRKKRGLSTLTTSRTYSSRIEAPYTRASIMTPSRPRFSISIHGFFRQISPTYTLPFINRPIETPLTSPAFSEVSNATSSEPPSMVSDYKSTCSSSPRTIPSPQLMFLPVIEDSPSYPAHSLESLSEIVSKRWMSHQPTMSSWHQPPDLPNPCMARVEPACVTRMGLNRLLN
ncbi:uncharacterized protein N7511_001707 [Penicillium nucicola]|uniref:uncharacterized protein n=1 Tax=Penicillium nucicola TaxID=1850975 RepID=UPI002545AC9A|nr:uncharacterized protein N7511_001707 [Penicillium nucicola]KAJ5776696.1 hypothetical protein N7511_001707 [Penicillium nucicola]